MHLVMSVCAKSIILFYISYYFIDNKLIINEVIPISKYSEIGI